MTETERFPDPTELTTAQLQREISTLKELLVARFEAVDAGSTLRAQVVMEKFDSVAQRFSERDTRTDQTARNDKVNLDAAFAAAKEAVGEQNKSSALAIAKSEAATTKQIDQVGSQLTVSSAALTDKIDDTKNRMNVIESRMDTIIATGHGVGLSASVVFQIVSSAGSAIAIIAFIMAYGHH